MVLNPAALKAIKFSTFGRNTVRHVLSSQSSHPSASAPSNRSAHNAAVSPQAATKDFAQGDYFTSAPAPPATDYSHAFFTPAPAPSAGSALAAPAAWDASSQHAEGRAGRGEHKSRSSAGSGWNFHSNARVAAIQISSTPVVDAGLLTRADEDEELRVYPAKPLPRRLSSVDARSPPSAPIPSSSSTLIRFANSKQAFQARIRDSLIAPRRIVASPAWPTPRLLITASYSTEPQRVRPENTSEPLRTPSQHIDTATIEELPSDEPSSQVTSQQQSSSSPQQPSRAPRPRRNKIRSSSLPSRLDQQRPSPAKPSEAAQEQLLQIQKAANGNSLQELLRVVEAYRASAHHSLSGHNAALAALAQWHSYDEPLQAILELFEEMLQLNIKPNMHTYGTVIEALAQRDSYVQVRLHRLRSDQAILHTSSVEQTTEQRGGAAQQVDSSPIRRAESALDKEIQSLAQDDSSTAAFQVYKALTHRNNPVLPQSTIHALLRLCIRHHRPRDALSILEKHLARTPAITEFEAVSLVIKAFAQVQDLPGATSVFERFYFSRSQQSDSDIVRQDTELLVWDEMIGAAFAAGDAHAAVSRFDQFTSSTTLGLKPDVRLLERMVSGFALLGDGASTLRWAERILDDPHFAQMKLSPAFLYRAVSLLASRITSLDYQSAADACNLYSIMRQHALNTDQAYSGAPLQQLITSIVPYTYSVERTPAVTQLWDQLAAFVQSFQSDAAKHPEDKSYLAPEAIALLEKARSSSASTEEVASVEDAHTDAHTQPARESVSSAHSEIASEQPMSAHSVASTATSPDLGVDAEHDKLSDTSLPIVRPLSPAASYAQEPNFAPQNEPHWDEEVQFQVEQVQRTSKVWDQGAAQAARIIVDAARSGRFIDPEKVAETLVRCGRSTNQGLIEELYLAGYASLSALESDPATQLSSWHRLENGALIAAANAGSLDRAAIHRDRLIEAGGAPTAEAYGTLILNAKDTTDDASVAIELFEESRKLGVQPNTFLFNNLISRLSKARRTKAVLECFEQMKAAGIATSSVTYGAVINACCKIGDVSAASFLFEEMTSLIDFVPKVPPYNTMIQFFVSTKPDRRRALYYYERMLKAGVKPSAHTYKLLLDCYGNLQPVDEESMKDVFKSLEEDSYVDMMGTHWGALISCYGLTQKNLDKAIEVFESIKSHLKSQRCAQPDAVAFEAILNSCVSNGRPDLVEHFSAEMKSRNMHSTAYCENARIKAFAGQGNLEGARQVFEALQDPPTGVAASGNHPGGRRHVKGRINPSARAGDPVFREPSSFEAMIRAEVTMGESSRATQLIERARQRAFPPQVIRGLEDLLTLTRAQ